MPTHPNPGSVYQRKKDGRWVVAVSLGGGKRIVRYASSKREAQGILQQLQREHHAGHLAAPSRLTFAQWVEEWLTLGAGHLRPTSRAVYQRALAPLVADLGAQRLDRVTPLALASSFSRMQARGRGTRAIEQAYAYTKVCLSRAVTLGLLGSNPLDRIPRPRHTPRQRACWTAEEARRFLTGAQMSPRRWAPLFCVVLGSGLRIGEALGLRWSDVDWERGTLRVERAIAQEGTRGHLHPPKTRAGQRTISVPPFALDALRRLPRPLGPDAPIFRTSRDTTPRRTNLLRAFQQLCRELDVPVITVHGLRHAHAALALANGVDVHTLRRRLGHSRASMTLDIYAYALRPDEQAAEALQRALQPPAADRDTTTGL